MTAPDPLRRKALTIIREGRLTVLLAECRKASDVVDGVVARVTSSRPGVSSYVVDWLEDGVWVCTCRATEVCPHIAATQIVTGHAPVTA